MRPRAVLVPTCLLIICFFDSAGVAFGETEDPAAEPRATAEPVEEPTAELARRTADASDDSVPIPAGTGAVTDALQGKNGLRIQTMCTHCNSANIQVGGLSKEFAPISRDEYPVFGGLATSLVMSILPSDTIADAKIEKGPGAAREPGPAAGGAIRLTESTPLELPSFDGAVEAGSFGLLGATARAAGRLGERLSGLIVAGSQEADPVDADGDGWNDVPAVDRLFGEGRLEVEAGQDHDVDLGLSWIQEDNLDGRGAYDVFADIDTPEDDSPVWTREDNLFDRVEARAGWTWSLGRGRQLEARLIGARRKQKVLSQLTQLEGFFGIPDSNRLFERFNIQETNRWGIVNYRHPIGLTWMARLGLVVEDQEVEAATIEAFDQLIDQESQPEEIVETVRTQSIYADVEWNPSAKWKVRAGLRRDDARWTTDEITQERTASRERTRTLPRVTVRFAPARGWTLKLVAGATFRPPRPILSEVCCGQRYQSVSNVVAETGETLGFEGAFQPTPDLRASVYVARSDFDEHILRLAGWSQFYIQTYALANVPEARANTAELVLRWSPHRIVTLDASYGWVSFDNTGDEIVTVLVTPPSFTEPQEVSIPITRIPYVADQSGSLSATFNLPRRTTVSFQASYTGEMLIQQYDQLLGLLDEMRRTPNFWVVSIRFTVPLSRRFDLFGAVNNLNDYVQDDLGDPSTDYNWGPLAGRAWLLGVRFRLPT